MLSSRGVLNREFLVRARHGLHWYFEFKNRNIRVSDEYKKNGKRRAYRFKDMWILQQFNFTVEVMGTPLRSSTEILNSALISR